MIYGICLGIVLSFLNSANAYYGRHSTEAILNFHAKADVTFSHPVVLEDLNHAGPARTLALKHVQQQIQHLMGLFQSVSFKETFGYPGVLGEDSKIRFTSVGAGSAYGRKLLEYDFVGPVVFQKDAFQNHPTKKVPIILPLAPDLVYKLGVKRGKNRCTDREFNEEEYFWYYWDPDQKGCPLAGDETNLIRTVGQLKRLKSTQVSYPEYDRLYGDNGNGDLFDIAVFLGYIGSKIPQRDDAYKAFRFLEKDLKDRGFAITRQKQDKTNYLVQFEKTIHRGGKPLQIRIQALLTETEAESRGPIFYRHLVRAFETADIVIYDGHSGFGKNIDEKLIAATHFNREKYQIFFFNGCSTYPYWNGSFFRAKGGSTNLEVITSGLPEFSTSTGPNLVAFLDRFIDGQTRTYQKILSELEESNGNENGTYLVGVKGDEDNVWHPVKR